VPTLDADYFDDWYSALAGSDIIEAAKGRYLGLPPELLSTSLLSMTGLNEVSSALQLTPESQLLDLGCGRGGYGLWLARETGCGLTGIDFSSVAVGAAREQIAAFGLERDRVSFDVGDLVATGLPDACVDAVMCIDAVQFASDQVACATECRRVLRPGGRVVLTCWGAIDSQDPAVPERLREIDLDRALHAAGFAEVHVEDKPDWLEIERSYWTHAVTHDPGDDPALQSWVGEGHRSLGWIDRLRRVLAVGVAD
jgi:SAM-dependent methyltransferase